MPAAGMPEGRATAAAGVRRPEPGDAFERVPADAAPPAPRRARTAAARPAGVAAISAPPPHRQCDRPSGHASADPIVLREKGIGGPARPARRPARTAAEKMPTMRATAASPAAAESRRALTDHHRAGEHVADALALGRQQAADHRGSAEEHPDLDHPGQRAKQRLAEAFRTAVVGYHPQPQRHLAQRPTPRRGLEHDRITHEHQHGEDDQHRPAQRRIELAQRGRPQHHADDVADEDHRDVDQRRERANR